METGTDFIYCSQLGQTQESQEAIKAEMFPSELKGEHRTEETAKNEAEVEWGHKILPKQIHQVSWTEATERSINGFSITLI